MGVSDFISASVLDTYDHLSVVEKQIGESRSRSVNYSKLDQLMTRLAVSRATKDRISSRFDHEIKDMGSNEWFVSQALTYLGQHEKVISFRVQDSLNRLGSTLLGRPLAHVVTDPAIIAPSGFYDIL